MISPLYPSIYLYVGLYALQNGWLLLVTVTMAPHPTWSPAWFSLPGQCQAAKQPSSPAFLSLVGWFRYTIHIHIHIYIYMLLWFIRIYDDSSESMMIPFHFNMLHKKWIIIMIYDLFRIFRLRLKSRVLSLVVFFSLVVSEWSKKEMGSGSENPSSLVNACHLGEFR